MKNLNSLIIEGTVKAVESKECGAILTFDYEGESLHNVILSKGMYEKLKNHIKIDSVIRIVGRLVTSGILAEHIEIRRK